MKALWTLLFVTVFLCHACAQNVDSENSDDITENTDMVNENFVGSWELQKWFAESNDGETVYPFGEDAIGEITYDRKGNMSVYIMKNNRSHFVSEDPLQARSDEVVQAFNGFLAYSGTYSIEPTKNQVVHLIKISSFPNWTGQAQIRYFAFDDDKLTLSTEEVGNFRHKLVWKKEIDK